MTVAANLISYLFQPSV